MASLDVGLAMTGNAVATVLTYPLVGILLDHEISSTFIVFAGNIFTVFGLIGIGKQFVFDSINRHFYRTLWASCENLDYLSLKENV